MDVSGLGVKGMQGVCVLGSWTVMRASFLGSAALCCVLLAVSGLAACADDESSVVEGQGSEVAVDAGSDDVISVDGQGSGASPQGDVPHGGDGGGEEALEGDAGELDVVDSDDAVDEVLEEDPDAEPPAWWGEPVEAPDREWTWVEVPEARCADGSPTGMGVNLNPGADKVFLYMEGGGACWDWDT